MTQLQVLVIFILSQNNYSKQDEVFGPSTYLLIDHDQTESVMANYGLGLGPHNKIFFPRKKNAKQNLASFKRKAKHIFLK